MIFDDLILCKSQRENTYRLSGSTIFTRGTRFALRMTKILHLAHGLGCPFLASLITDIAKDAVRTFTLLAFKLAHKSSYKVKPLISLVI